MMMLNAEQGKPDMDTFLINSEKIWTLLLAFDAWNDIGLLLLYGTLATASIWLAWHRKQHHLLTYSVYAASFFAFALGVWPGYANMNTLGLVGLIIATGFHIVMGVVLDLHKKRGMDLRKGKSLP